MAHAQEHPGQIDRDDLAPLFEGDFMERLVTLFDAGIIEGAVEPAEPLDGSGDGGGDVLIVRDVGRERDGDAPIGLDQRGRFARRRGIVVDRRPWRTGAPRHVRSRCLPPSP